MIPEPQRTYVLELLQALGPIADDFVVAGAQAMKFMLRQARAFNFVAAGPVSRIRRVTLQPGNLLNRNRREPANDVNIVSDGRFCVTRASQP
jgi:hypothetical protein